MKHQIEKIERKKEKREGCIDVSMTTGERGLSWLLSRTATGSSSQPISLLVLLKRKRSAPVFDSLFSATTTTLCY